MGLIYPNKDFKPGAEAFVLTAGYLAGTEYHPELPSRDGIGENITSLYFSRDDGTSILIIWKNNAGKQKLILDVPNAVCLARHDIHNRNIVLLPDKPVLEVTRGPVFITWYGGEAPRLYRLEK